MPAGNASPAGPHAPPALRARGLSKCFGGGHGWRSRLRLGRPRPLLQALSDVSFDVARGETLGLVGESGCGKSTLARILTGLLEADTGSVELAGAPLRYRGGGRQIQYVFQDPLSALNPRKTIRQILDAPLRHLLGLGAAARRARIAELLDAVRLRAEFLDRYPHEFSGGQAQRIGIARALAAEPDVLVLDEPVSALDVSVQAQVLNLLAELRDALGLTYLFISHDLAVVDAVSDRIAVLYFGRVVEIGDAAGLFAAPHHPYTALLARSAPRIDAPLAAESAAAELPDPLRPPPGCAFAARCPRADDGCRERRPALAALKPDRAAACFHPLDA